jgi:hypothetical protein
VISFLSLLEREASILKRVLELQFKRELWDDTEQEGSERCWKTTGKVISLWDGGHGKMDGNAGFSPSTLIKRI